MSTGNTNPTAWAASKRSLIASYLRGEVAASIARAAAVLSPGVPAAAWLGVACNGGPNENTTGWVTGSAAERAEASRVGHAPLTGSTRYDPNDASLWANRGFHELGVFGEEGGPASGPAPAANSNWSHDAVTAGVRAVLGRAASVSPGGWRAVPDQVAVGLEGLARHGREVRAQLPEVLRWAVDAHGAPLRWTQWVFVCSVMGWSAGSTGAARHLGRWPELGAVDESRRWGAWLSRLVAEVRPGTARSHGNPFYSAVRTAQKMEAGRLAGTMMGDVSAEGFLDPGLGADVSRVYDAITAGGYGLAMPPSSGGTSGATTHESLVGKALTALLLLATGGLLAILTDGARSVR